MTTAELQIRFVSAENLRAVNKDGKTSDPYCSVFYNGKRVGDTNSVQETVNPVWQVDEFQTIRVSSTDPYAVVSPVTVTIHDERTGFGERFKASLSSRGDKLLGQVLVVPKDIPLGVKTQNHYDVIFEDKPHGRLTLELSWLTAPQSLTPPSTPKLIRYPRLVNMDDVKKSEIDLEHQEDFEDESGFVLEKCEDIQSKLSLVTENVSKVGAVGGNVFGFEPSDSSEKKAAKVLSVCQTMIDKASLDGDMSFLTDHTKMLTSILIKTGDFLAVVGSCAPFCSAAGVVVKSVLQIVKNVSMNNNSCKELANAIEYMGKICENLATVFQSPKIEAMTDKGIVDSLALLFTLMLKSQAVCRETQIAVNEWSATETTLVKKAVKYVLRSSSFKSRFEKCSAHLDDVRQSLDGALQVTQAALLGDVADSLSKIAQQLSHAPKCISDAMKSDLRNVVDDLKKTMHGSEDHLTAALREQNVTLDTMKKNIEAQYTVIVNELDNIKKNQDEMNKKLDLILRDQSQPLTPERHNFVISMSTTLPPDIKATVLKMIASKQSYTDIATYLLDAKDKASRVTATAEKQRLDETNRKYLNSIA